MTRLQTAWRSLSGAGSGDGWRSTFLTRGVGCRILAARRQSDDREAILVGFQDVRLPSSRLLPTGQGFLVETLVDSTAGFSWMALSRQDGASPALFETMAEDLVTMLTRDDLDRSSLRTFLSRIEAWQAFMLPTVSDRLGPDSEAGLIGELHVLEALGSTLHDAAAAVVAWEGPEGGLHDFVVGGGAIEVKSTVSASGFHARIGSLQQLDPAGRPPLCLAAVRLATTAGGATLPGHVERVSAWLRARSPMIMELLETRLLHAGYHPVMADQYVRMLEVTDWRLLPVDDDFPVLVPRNVPRGVVSASYTVDLDMAPLAQITLDRFLVDAGVPTAR